MGGTSNLKMLLPKEFFLSFHFLYWSTSQTWVH